MNECIVYTFDPANKGSEKLADFGRRNQLPCGGHWIVGSDFAFQILYGASSYNHFQTVEEYGRDINHNWPEIRHRLMLNSYIWVTEKSRDEVYDLLDLISGKTRRRE